MARVNLDGKVWTDPRFDLLARELGIDRFSAIARCAKLWNACTELERHELPPEAIRFALEHDRGAEALVVAGLGEVIGGSLVYVKGTKDRIEWLGRQRAAGRKGGKKSGAQRRRDSLAAARAQLAKRAEERANGAPDKTPVVHQQSLPIVGAALPEIRSQMAEPAEVLGPEATLKGRRTPLAPALAPVTSPASEDQIRKKQERATPAVVSIDPIAELASYLLEAIRTHTPRFGADPARWVNDLRLLVEADGQPIELVRAVIDFVHRDERGAFYRSGVVAGVTLRKKFPQLLVATSNAAQGSGRRGEQGYSAAQLLEQARLDMQRGRGHK